MPKLPVQAARSVAPAKLPVLAAEDCVCVVGGPIDFIGKKWTMCAIVTIGNHAAIRFNDLLASLGTVSPRTLSETLKLLEAEGVVQRTAYREVPPRVEYRLTAEGVRLREALAPLMVWASNRPGAVCQPTRPKAPSTRRQATTQRGVRDSNP